MGEEGKKEVEKLLDDRDEATRVVAFRALRQHSDDIVKYAQHLVEDPSPFVKREIILGLAEYPYPVKKPILLQLLKNFDSSDRWYLEALGNAVSGHDEDFILEIEKLFNEGKAKPEAWSDEFEMLVWRLHPAKYMRSAESKSAIPQTFTPSTAASYDSTGFYQ